MNLRHVPTGLVALTLLLACSVLTPASAADKPDKSDKPKSDLIPPDKRRVSVELGLKLTQPPTPEPLPADLAQPFNPPGFDLPDREERPPTPGTSPGRSGGGGEDTNPARPAAAVGDRETLEALAARIVPKGTFVVGGQPLLVIGSFRLSVGAHFTVNSNGQDYDLELTAINSTTFTLRYHNEETTRPIKPGK